MFFWVFGVFFSLNRKEIQLTPSWSSSFWVPSGHLGDLTQAQPPNTEWLRRPRGWSKDGVGEGGGTPSLLGEAGRGRLAFGRPGIAEHHSSRHTGHLCGTWKAEDEGDQTTHRVRRGAYGLAFPYIFHWPVPTVGSGWGRSCPSGSGARALSSAWDERLLRLTALLPHLGGRLHADLQAHGAQLIQGSCNRGLAWPEPPSCNRTGETPCALTGAVPKTDR